MRRYPKSSFVLLKRARLIEYGLGILCASLLSSCAATPQEEPVSEEATTQALGTGPYYTNITNQIPGLSGLNGFHVSSADVNSDGYPDLLVAAAGDTGSSFTDYRLLLNRNGKSFEDFTEESGIRASRRGTNDRRSSFGVFADVDNDGGSRFLLWGLWPPVAAF